MTSAHRTCLPRPAALAALLAAACATALFPTAARAADGPVQTIAGTTAGYSGDGGPATLAQLSSPRSIALGGANLLLIADSGNGALREVGPDGVIRNLTPSRDRTAPGLGFNPAAVAYDAALNPIVADPVRDVVVRISRGDGANVPITETVIAGTPGVPGSGGDGGPATAGQLSDPAGLSVQADGSILIADSGNNKIRVITPAGQLATLAGTGLAGAGGDGGPAPAARLSAPMGVTVVPEGGFLVADTGNHRIRRVAADGTIATVAGGGGRGGAGDGGPGVGAQLWNPMAVAPLRVGGMVIADTGNSRLRRVTPLGTIFTIAGSAAGFGGDGGAMSAALFSGPQGIIGAGQGFIVADSGNSRIRSVASDGVLPGPVGGRTLRITPVGGKPRATPAGQRTSIPLREPDVAELGTEAATTAGQVQVETATSSGGVRTANVTGGDFTIDQPTSPAETVLALSAPLNGCRAKEGGVTLKGSRASRAEVTASAAKAKQKKKQRKKKRKRRTRKIFVSSDGGHRTNGRYADAVVRGTQWSVQDYCTSSRIAVKEGSVRVRDRVKRKTVIVNAGERYVARRSTRTR